MGEGKAGRAGETGPDRTGAGRAGPGGKVFGAAEQALVVQALGRGVTVRAAAAAVGFDAGTLYYRRKRCTVFKAAWEAAAADGRRPVLVAANCGRGWQIRRSKGNRFGREAKEAFLEHFSATCDATASADAAGVCVSTVYDHRRTDPAFAEGWGQALEQGYARLEAEVLRQRLAAQERLAFRGDKEVAADDSLSEKEEFDRAMHLLREHKRGLAGVAKDGRPPGRSNIEEARARLEKKMRALGIRMGDEGE